MSRPTSPLVTVILASYNHRSYVEAAVRSIVRQDWPAIDLLVIDDGSTDGSADLLQTLRDKDGFRLICRQNGGLISVINQGIQEARGEYVVIHASDDESLPGRLSAQVATLERFPRAAFVSSNIALVTEDGRPKGTLLSPTGKETSLEFEDILLQRAQVSSVACMYRTAALKHLGSLDVSYCAEDPQVFLRLTRLGYSWVQSAGAPVLNYRMLHSSQSRTRMPRLLREQLRLLDEFSDHPLCGKAKRMVRTALISSLAEQDKLSAIREALSGPFDVTSFNFIRMMVKVALPRRWHHLLKRAG